MTVTDRASIRQGYTDLLARPPHLRARDAATALGITEAALVASAALGSVVALRADWPALISRLSDLGPVMVLTRNEHAVHERHGRYQDVSAGPGHILVLGPDIDLRLFHNGWAFAYALGGVRPSIQIFDGDGDAVHKVYAMQGRTLPERWADLVVPFTAPNPAPPRHAAVTKPASAAETLVDATSLRADWLALRDTHDFFPMLRKHRATRRQAFNLAGADLALGLDPAAAEACLTDAAARAIPIMVFVGNRSAIQIHSGPVHSGPVHRLMASPGGWFNVLDPEFNLHLRTTGIAQAWRVVKPTEDGDVTSIELLDTDGDTSAQFFGARKPGQPERADWRDLVAGVTARFATQARAA